MISFLANISKTLEFKYMYKTQLKCNYVEFSKTLSILIENASIIKFQNQMFNIIVVIS